MGEININSGNFTIVNTSYFGSSIGQGGTGAVHYSWKLGSTNEDGSETTTGGTINIRGGNFKLKRRLVDTPMAPLPTGAEDIGDLKDVSAIGGSAGNTLVDMPAYSVETVGENKLNRTMWFRARHELYKILERDPNFFKNAVNPININITGGIFDFYGTYGRMIGTISYELYDVPFDHDVSEPARKLSVNDYANIHISGDTVIRSNNHNVEMLGGIGDGARTNYQNTGNIKPGSTIMIGGNTSIDFTKGYTDSQAAVIGGGAYGIENNITITDNAKIKIKQPVNKIFDGSVGYSSMYAAAIGTGTTGFNLNLQILGNAEVEVYSESMAAAIGSGYGEHVGIYNEVRNTSDDAYKTDFTNSDAMLYYFSRPERNNITIGGNAKVSVISTTKDNGNYGTPAIGFGHLSGGTLNIQDNATVFAKSKSYAAAIGSGFFNLGTQERSKATINISGSPIITAIKDPTIVVKLASGQKATRPTVGAAIGSGYNNQASINITGSPTIYALGGPSQSSAIGGHAQSEFVTLNHQMNPPSELSVNVDKGAKFHIASTKRNVQIAPLPTGSGFQILRQDPTDFYMPMVTYAEDVLNAKGNMSILNFRLIPWLGVTDDFISDMPNIEQTETIKAIPLEAVDTNGDAFEITPVYIDKNQNIYAGTTSTVPKDDSYFVRSKNVANQYGYINDENNLNNFNFGVQTSNGTASQDNVQFNPMHLFVFEVAETDGTITGNRLKKAMLSPWEGAIDKTRIPGVTASGTKEFEGWEIDGAVLVDGTTKPAGSVLTSEETEKLVANNTTPARVMFRAAFRTPATPEPTATPTPEPTPSVSTTPKLMPKSMPKTGDSTPIQLLVIGLVLALGTAVVVKKKRTH